MRNYRVGLVGLGQVSEAHLEGYRNLERIRVVAAAELREDRLGHVVGKWGLRGYSTVEQMLEKESLDIVCILTPARTHCEITKQAAIRGIHILCEKPLAVTEEEARAMITVCDEAGVGLWARESVRSTSENGVRDYGFQEGCYWPTSLQ
jgi:predicted dehydrogenase